TPTLKRSVAPNGRDLLQVPLTSDFGKQICSVLLLYFPTLYGSNLYYATSYGYSHTRVRSPITFEVAHPNPVLRAWLLKVAKDPVWLL
ncbi:MAG: hypothetical protein ACLQUY_18925, partial [Ktedonobacterales bacterium]